MFAFPYRPIFPTQKTKVRGRKGGNFREVRPLARIVLVAGFETFNLQLYNQVVGCEGG